MATERNGMDRITDWLAIALATVVALSTWGLFLHEYLTPGEVPTWLLGFAALMSMLAVITLFGKEKVNAALDAISEQ